jgi:hypothetical protein
MSDEPPDDYFEAAAGVIELFSEIEDALRRIKETRAATRGYDEEMRRLGEETRSLIAEMQRDLNLKAA